MYLATVTVKKKTKEEHNYLTVLSVQIEVPSQHLLRMYPSLYTRPTEHFDASLLLTSNFFHNKACCLRPRLPSL